MTSLRWQVFLLVLAAIAIPSGAKITVSSNGIGVQVLPVKSAPKKKKSTPSFCEDDTCNASDSGKPACGDKHADCAQRAKNGECESNSNFMLEQCKESCFVCGHNW